MNRARLNRNRLYITLFYLGLIAVWEGLYSAHLAPDYLFPSPLAVARRLWELGTEGYLWPSIKATLTRMLLGFSIALVLGLTLGMVMGLSQLANQCFKSLLLGLQTLPTAAWTPIAMLIYGLSDRGIYFVILMSSIPAIAIATSDGILQIPPIIIRAAQTLGTPRYAMPVRVILPAALPNIVTGIKLGWTLGWHGAVSAELIKSSVGLGYLLYIGRELNDPSQVIGIMLLTILFGLLLDRFIFGKIEYGIRCRYGLEAEQDVIIA